MPFPLGHLGEQDQFQGRLPSTAGTLDLPHFIVPPSGFLIRLSHRSTDALFGVSQHSPVYADLQTQRVFVILPPFMQLRLHASTSFNTGSSPLLRQCWPFFGSRIWRVLSFVPFGPQSHEHSDQLDQFVKTHSFGG